MTVKELIEKLQGIEDQDSQVFVTYDWYENHADGSCAGTAEQKIEAVDDLGGGKVWIEIENLN